MWDAPIFADRPGLRSGHVSCLDPDGHALEEVTERQVLTSEGTEALVNRIASVCPKQPYLLHPWDPLLGVPVRPNLPPPSVITGVSTQIQR